MNKKAFFTSLVLAAMLLVSAIGPQLSALAAPSPTGAIVVTDLLDYGPGMTVTLTGTGWVGGEVVHIYVNDDAGQSWSLDSGVNGAPPDPIADEMGGFSYQFDLPGWWVANYNVVATGPISGVATTTFTDANPSANLDQCANDPLPSLSSDGCNTDAAQWVNGNVNESKSVYFEGDSVPYRMRFANFATTPGNSHTVTIQWDTTKSSKHALDYLTTYNRTVLDADPCLGVSGCSSATVDTYDIPIDEQVGAAKQMPGVFTMFGGDITSVSGYTYDPTGFVGDTSASISITFEAKVSNPVLAWSGHISERSDWGAQGAAVAIPGSPYHTRLLDLDGSGGNQDRSLSAAAVIYPASIKVVKDADPDSDASFGFTAGPAPLANFSLVDDGSGNNWTLFDEIIDFQSYSVNETSIPTHWGFDSASCDVSSPNGGSYDNSGAPLVTINLKEGENWVCTYDNSLRDGTLTVIKHVINDNGGTATADEWTIHVKQGVSEVTDSPQAGSETGTEYWLPAGTYTASETGGADGYAFDGFSGDCDKDGIIVLAAGDDKTCTLTNNDKQAYITVTKVVTKTHGGTAVPDDFDLTLEGNPVLSGVKVAVNPGTYTAGETLLAGYKFDGFSGDCDSNGDVTVALGESKTCTLTNHDLPATVTLYKVVNNDHGGTAVPDDFKLTLEGNPVLSGVSVEVNAGTYTAGETLLAGYEFNGFAGDCDSNGDITVAVGENKGCTLTNSDKQAYITVVKKVNNDHGGTALPDDFKLTLEGNPVLSGVKVPVNPGTYTAGETLLAGYEFNGFSGDCDSNGDVTVALGDDKTCTLTNSDKQAYITVVKKVNNDHGGTALPDDFDLTLEGNPVLSGVAVPVNPGTYTADETLLPGYTFDGLSGDCDENGEITVALGERKTCTLTNSDKQAYITVVKKVNNDHGGTALPDDFKLTLEGNPVLSGVKVPVNPGTYTAGETLLAGYKFDNFSGACDSNGDVTVALGDDKTCTLTNSDKQSYVTVIKDVKNMYGGTALPDDFKLTLEGNPVLSGVKVPVNPGTYTAGETLVSGYKFEGFSLDCDENGDVTVALGESKECKLTNSDIQPKLTLIKYVINDNGGTKIVSDFPLFIDGKPVTSGTPNGLDAGEHTASELQQYGYKASDWGGDCAADGKVTLNIGDDKTCTITNNDKPGTIVVVKLVKPVGSTAQFDFQTTGDGGALALPDYQPFSLMGAQMNSQQLDAGLYTVKEIVAAGWTLTGIGSSNPSHPYSCVVTGSGGSTGTGDLNTQTATINLKIGDTVTCYFENTGSGTTRTQGFWSTHPQLAALAWFGGEGFGHTFPGVANVGGIGDTMICGRNIDTLGKLMGGFWSNIAKTTTKTKRTALDQSRMQLLQQLLAAELNASAFGTMPIGGSAKFAQWESALCGTNISAIQTALKQAAGFNSQGDTLMWTPGTSADAKYAKSIANKVFWNIIKP